VPIGLLALILGVACLLLTIAGTMGPVRREVAVHG